MESYDAGLARDRLLEILLHRSLQFGDFLLRSGERSTYYIDVRKTSLDPEGVSLIARMLCDRCALGQPSGPTAVGGPTLGADPLVTALGLRALELGREVECFLVRRQAKDHGAGNRIEGNLSPAARVLVVDDVLTRGASLLDAIEAVESTGAKVVAVACVVDREAGGEQRLRAPGREIHSLFGIGELLAAAGKADPA